MKKELTARELRIGNFLSYKGRIIQVTMIGEYGIQSKFDTITINAKFATDDLKPIPLTSEWLLRAGFYIREGSSVWKKEINYLGSDFPCTLQLTNNGTAMQICRSGIGATCAPCEYVHQLQNLYFALCGTELTFKDIEP